MSSCEDSYIIDFKDLKVGDYHFDFSVGASLFAPYEECEVLGGDCEVKVEMQRSESMLSLQVAITGDVEVACDRCLEPCAVEVDYDAPLVVKFIDEARLTESEFEYDGEVMWLPTGATELNLAQYIYESIILSLPYQRVHEEGDCNPEMMERFRIVTGEEFEEIEKASEESDNETMPADQLAKLQALKAKMEGK